MTDTFVRPPLWAAELDSQADHQGETLCEGCREWVPNDVIKYVAKDLFHGFHHMCVPCIKILPYPVINFEDTLPENQNFF